VATDGPFVGAGFRLGFTLTGARLGLGLATAGLRLAGAGLPFGLTAAALGFRAAFGATAFFRFETFDETPRPFDGFILCAILPSFV
jgi:hypothetical protein